MRIRGDVSRVRKGEARIYPLIFALEFVVKVAASSVCAPSLSYSSRLYEPFRKRSEHSLSLLP